MSPASPASARRAAAVTRTRPSTWRDRFETELKTIAPDAIVFGADAPRLSNTSNFALPGVSAETAVMALDLDGVMVSSGSACSSGKVKPSHVLRAMGVSETLAQSALRVSFGWNSTEADVDASVTSISHLLSRARARAAEPPDVRRARYQETGRRDRREVQIRLRHRHRDGARAQGPLRRHGALSSRPRRASRTGCWNGASAPSALAGDARAQLGARALSEDRLPERLLLRRAQEHAAEAEPGRSRSQAAGDLQEARHPAARADGAGRRRGRRGVRLRLGRDHLQGQAQRSRRDLLPDLRSDPRPSRAGEEISGHRRAGDRQFLRDAEFGGVLRRHLRLCAQGRALPDGAVDLFPHQCQRDRPVRAHADHRRRRLLRLLSRRLHRAQARREPAARRRGRTGRAGRRRDQILDGAELVSRRRERRSAASTISSPSAAIAAATAPRSPGPRSKPARPSPGNIPAASCAATTRSASSIPSPSPTISSRPTPAPR